MILLISAVEAGLGAQISGMGSAYSSTDGISKIYPFLTIIVLVIIFFLVRRAIRKNRLEKELHYKINQKVMSITKLDHKVSPHVIGTILKIHSTNPITLDVEFKNESEIPIRVLKVEETDIVKIH